MEIHRIKNQAHHLLPQEFNDFVSNPEIHELTKKVNYDINRGENIIFLPAFENDGDFHNLPYHFGGHDKYNRTVLKDAKKLEELLKEYKGTEPCKDGDDIPEDIAKEFGTFENELWKIIVKAGKGNSINKIKTLNKNKKKRNN